MTTADRMAVLDQGVVQQVGAPVALYDEPANLIVAGFVGTTNLLPARVRSRRGDALTLDVAGLGDVPLPAGVQAPAADTLTLGFRPHALAMAGADDAAAPAGIALPGTVEASEFLGEFTRYSVRVGPHALAVDHPHQAGGAPFAVGSAVQLGLQVSQLRLFVG
ncbi:MAG: hypothetical protein C0505_15790 [Leptothrix sp. (in: Bacteria)]|nr:hypothetical protein [Leptothrix sp. (in: b-proteobacteria)]